MLPCKRSTITGSICSCLVIGLFKSWFIHEGAMKERDKGEWKSDYFADMYAKDMCSHVCYCCFVQTSALNILVKGLQYCISICTINTGKFNSLFVFIINLCL